MEVKRKRGRPKKVQIPDEIQQLVDVVNETKAKEDAEYHKVAEEVKEKYRSGKWDVPIGKEIKFFDKRLSYEITGYRPITKDKGLDFNPNWFTEARDVKLKTGHYCQYQFGSKLYHDFWTREYKRCINGYTVNGYTITGPHYFFLNYYQLPNPDVEKAGTSRLSIYPNFYTYQYEFFHYYELCRTLHRNCGLMKSRGIGFSEINAALIANEYSCHQASNSILTAFNSNYVEKSLEKVWNELTFLNDETDLGFFKLRQVFDSQLKKRASFYKIINGQKVEDGFMSQIEGIIAEKDSKIRGDRADLLILEEAGSNPIFSKSFVKAEALTTLGGNKIGVIVAGGTGGDTGPQMAGLIDMYYNPESVDILPFYHNYTPDGTWVYTCFFIPAYTALYKKGFVDERGVCDDKRAKEEFYDKERDKRKATPKKLVEYCAEFCYTAEEAFALEGTNKFNKVLLTDQITRIRLLKEGPTIQNGELQFIYKGGNREIKNVSGVRWVPGNEGKVHIIEKPLWEDGATTDEDGNPISYQEMRNLYVAGIDSIDIGEEQTSDLTKDPSKFCIVIKRRAFGTRPPQYVAYYMDRPDNEREAYQTALKMLMYYNCRANIEATRLSMKTWLQSNGMLGYLMSRPKATYPDPNGKHSNAIGTPATPAIIAHQTDLIRDFIDDYCDEIWFPEFLDQATRYSDEQKGKFDIIAAWGMAELADEELTGIRPTDLEPESDKEWQDIGWYKDEYGRRKFGVIPKKDNNVPKYNIYPETYYDGYNRTSDPRRN